MKMTTVDLSKKPTTSIIPQSILQPLKSYIDDQKYSLINAINDTNEKLQQCGWYYPHMTRDEAKEILYQQPPGAFLLRQSSESLRNYTLSVRTPSGPVVSIRIIATCRHGNISFRLDCSRKITDFIIEESCVVNLIQRLIATRTLDIYRFSDNKGKRNISLQLTKPVILRSPSLKHLCRVRLNQEAYRQPTKSLESQHLRIPSTLKNYLAEYVNIV
ncbi:suppressor of cytokine signaling 2-like [Watersipora subatra]|uniref:suppressor of cytokine signaling 2-like n=1 Tax=Watersipora subatra TaxID=2589382 RepID=UPI00355C3FA3